MATQAVVRQRVKDYLYGSNYNNRPYEDLLDNSGDVGAGDGTITVANMANWGVGDILEFNTTGEQCLITSKQSHLHISRGYNGTTAASVTDATLVTKNPKFTISKIDNVYQLLLMNFIQKSMFLLLVLELSVIQIGIMLYLILDSKKYCLCIIHAQLLWETMNQQLLILGR